MASGQGGSDWTSGEHACHVGNHMGDAMKYDLIIEVMHVDQPRGRFFHSGTRISVDGGRSWIIRGRLHFPKGSIRMFETRRRVITWDEHLRRYGRNLTFSVST